MGKVPQTVGDTQTVPCNLKKKKKKKKENQDTGPYFEFLFNSGDSLVRDPGSYSRAIMY